MQSLAKRHEDRARRLANNKGERGGAGDPSRSIGSVALAYENFATMAAGLSEAERKELAPALEGINANIESGYRSLAEAEDGSTMAGIGVVNPFVVPTKSVAVEPLPESEIDPSKGNINGQALTDQLGEASGWGTSGTAKSSDLDAKTDAKGDGKGEAKK
jgi:hypothetical protein